MALIDLLKDPEAYRIGTTGQNAASKGIDYPEGQGPLLGKRAQFNIKDPNAEPTLFNSWTSNDEGISHSSSNLIDAYIRGGIAVNVDRRKIDFERITAFLKTPAGDQFKQTQTALQALNPRPQRIYNYGINTLASVAASGVSNVRRGGLLPSVGGFDLMGMLGFDKTTYEGEKEKKGRGDAMDPYKLGDPGKPTSNSFLDKVIGFDPFKKPKGYDVRIEGRTDLVNELPIFMREEGIANYLETDAKDFVPFRFEVKNQEGGANDIIVFRAFLDTISDDYNATHNSYKYNGRGEEFYTYNKFNRKIQVGFKIAAQTRHEMKPIYQKINYLAAQTAPNYSSVGRIRTPYMYLTVGDWFQKIPGLMTSVSLTWQKDYPWEIALDRFSSKDGTVGGKDAQMLILPHVLDVNVSFQPIHNFTPSNNIASPFIGINGNGVVDSWIEDTTDVETALDKQKKAKADYMAGCNNGVGSGCTEAGTETNLATNQQPTTGEVNTTTTDNNFQYGTDNSTLDLNSADNPYNP
tara:strand:+ start:329 stop:1888 length:1560 start_codon:yes stop_codon:yes gene_type:complete